MSRQTTDVGFHVSAILLAIGVFLPLTTLRVIGDVSYEDVADVEAYMIIGVVIAGVVLALTKPRLTGLAAVGVWVVLMWPAIEDLFRSNDSGIFSGLEDSARRIMHDFAADLLPDLVSNIADFHWGGFVFLLSLLGFTFFGIAKSIKG